MTTRILWALSALIAWTAISWPQEMAVPIEVQYPLFLKILVFDRNLEQRVGQEVVLGILYQSHFRRSLNTRDELLRLIAASPPATLKDRPVRYRLIEVGEDAPLDSLVARDIDLLYVAPLRAFDLNEIARLSRARQITTLTGVPEYGEAGIAVSLGIRGDRPQVIINLPAARAAGADFSAQLLKLSRVIQ